MRYTPLLLAMILAGTFTSGSAEAQICSGAGPFSNGSIRIAIGSGSIGSGFGGADGEHAVGAQLAFGAMRGPFASVSGSVVLYDSSNRFTREGLAARTDDAGAGIVGFTGGYSILLSTSRNVELCPLAGISMQSGPDGWSECSPLPTGGTRCSGSVHGRARAFWLGGSIGTRLPRTPALVPFARAAFVRSTMIWSAADGSESITDYYVPISVGTGLVLNRMTLRASIDFRQGLDGGNPTGALLLGFNIGTRTPQ